MQYLSCLKKLWYVVRDAKATRLLKVMRARRGYVAMVASDGYMRNAMLLQCQPMTASGTARIVSYLVKTLRFILIASVEVSVSRCI